MADHSAKHIQSYYDAQAQNYNEIFFEHPTAYPTLLYRQSHILQWISKLPLQKQFAIADLGCGTGDLIRELYKLDALIYGIDFSQQMVDIAKEKNEQGIANGKVVIMQGDVERLPEAVKKQKFDVIVLSGVIEYLSSDELWLQSVLSIINPGGYLIVNVTNPKCIRRITQQPFEWLKRAYLIRKLAGFIKEDIFKKGPLNYFDFAIRLHSPDQFDKLMRNKGFRKEAHRFFDYALLPYPFDKLVERFTLSWKKKMETIENGKHTLWGGGYIGLYQYQPTK